jgi:CDP-4-dehydro-6-deoxyglucose reductase
MAQVTLTNGAHFNCEPSETLLDAAARANIVLAYSCRKGRCSACKCKQIRGSSALVADETGLSNEEKAEGWILTCVRTATEEMEIDADDLSGMAVPPVRTLPCRVHELTRLAPDVLHIKLRLPPATDFTFLPGQYVDVIGQGGIRRSYSLASAPAPSRPLEIHVRETPAGAMSDYWFKRSKINDLLRLNGPLGTCFLRKMAGLNLIFLATGTGIAPIKAMIEGLAVADEHSKPRSVTVYWGGRSVSDLYWNMAERSGIYRYVPVLSRADSTWTGARGYVQSIAIAENPVLSDALVYACGSESMINSARRELLHAGLPAARFHSDAFVSSASTQLEKIK